MTHKVASLTREVPFSSGDLNSRQFRFVYA